MRHNPQGKVFLEHGEGMLASGHRRLIVTHDTPIPGQIGADHPLPGRIAKGNGQLLGLVQVGKNARKVLQRHQGMPQFQVEIDGLRMCSRLRR